MAEIAIALAGVAVGLTAGDIFHTMTNDVQAKYLIATLIGVLGGLAVGMAI